MPSNVFSSLDNIPEAARAIFESIGERDVFLSPPWFDLLLRHCPPDGDPAFWVNEGCVLPLVRRKQTLCSLSNFYTMRFLPISDQRISNTVYVDAILSEISTSRPSWHSLHLRNLPGHIPMTQHLLAAIRHLGWRARLYFQHENWFEPTAGVTSKAYLEGRPSKLSNTLDRKWRKANREHKISFRLYHSPGHTDAAITDYHSIYAKSWKDPERFPEFIPALIRHCAHRDALRLGVLYVDGAPAATHFWIVTGSRATIYKLAYDDAYVKLSVGSILTRLMFEYVLDCDKVDEVDYGTGSESYKRDWMADSRPIFGLIAHNPRTPLGLLLAARDSGSQATKRLLRHPDSGPTATND